MLTLLAFLAPAFAGPVGTIPAAVPPLNNPRASATPDEKAAIQSENLQAVTAFREAVEPGGELAVAPATDLTDFLKNIVISGNLDVAPGASPDGLLSPSVTGSFTDTSVFKRKKTNSNEKEPVPGLLNDVTVNIDFQAPPAAATAAEVTDSIKLSDGGTGALALSEQITYTGTKAGIAAGLHLRGAWQAAGTLTPTTTAEAASVQALDSSSFFLGSGSASVGVYYLVYLGAKATYFYAAGDPGSAVVQEFGAAPISVQAMLAAKLKLGGTSTDTQDKTLWVILEGLPYTGSTGGDFGSRFQVSLSTTFKPF